MAEPRLSVPEVRTLKQVEGELRALDQVDPSREVIRAIVAVYAGEARLQGLDADAAVNFMERAIDGASRQTGVPWRYRVRLIVITEFVAAYRAIVTDGARPP